MKAVLCRQPGPPESLVFGDVPSLVAGPGQVVVGVKAAGVNFPDTLIIQGKYQFKPPMPFSPGGECAGVVTSVGDGVTGVKAGDRVIALTTWGAFAEEVVADATALVPLPDGLDFAPAAGFILTYGTSYHALKDRARLQPGETLLVLGASGGVGLSAVQLGKAMGARVIACASSDAKLAVCRAAGADETIDYSREDLRARVKALTGGKGVDVVYDPVGGTWSELALRDMAWNGRFLVIGFAAGDIPKIPLNLALLKGCSIVGVFWGAFTKAQPDDHRRNNAELLALWQAGRIAPHLHATYPLERAADALNALLAKQVSGKVVLVTP
ncbi:MAG: NADPH:quinone oxidoreductase family protein [Burkholderiales bacterium]|nr:NADPH:quinone oxidoreductase family protein [Burkholderiales bacterium]